MVVAGGDIAGTSEYGTFERRRREEWVTHLGS